MRNYMTGSLVLALLCCQGIDVRAQSGPSCREINIPVQANDSARFLVQDIVAGAAAVGPMTIQVMNPFNGVMHLEENATAATEIEIPACKYIDKELNVMVTGDGLSCNAKITFKAPLHPRSSGRSIDVLCTDPLVTEGDIDRHPPMARLACQEDKMTTFSSDWIVPYPCDGANDTAKVIYRSYEAKGKDDSRILVIDTITAFKIPAISPENTYCGEKDTAYCTDRPRDFGPYILVEDPPMSGYYRRLYLLHGDGTAKTFDQKCGLNVNVEKQPFPTDCGELAKFTVQIKQTCPGPPILFQDTAVYDFGNEIFPLGEGYWTCTFWHVVLDTTPPTISCGMPVQTLFTESHSCSTQTTLPPIIVTDRCHKVTQVKAMIEGFGSVTYEPQDYNQWVSTQLISLPLSSDSVKVTFEAIDECHNIGVDSCFFVVKDKTPPIAVAEKRVNVTMAGKKAWIQAESFNEHSWDNCDISLILARRIDWKESCVNLCDNVEMVAPLSGDDALWRAVLDSDTTLSEVESHYQETINWLLIDGQACAPIVSEAWHYDLMKHATVECKKVLTEAEFDTIVDDYLNQDLTTDQLEQVKQIGGGWSYEVPISCEDICNPVKVELLVMDYWCNWSKSWSEAWIDDSGIVDIAEEVTPTIEISCRSFNTPRYTLAGNDINLAGLVEAAGMGNQSALDQIDVIFGAYREVWKVDGELVDANKTPIDREVNFIDSTCKCVDSTYTVSAYDSTYGRIVEQEREGRYCFYQDSILTFLDGAIVVSCPDNIYIDRKLTAHIDDCGQGWIKRTWKMWNECKQEDANYTGHTPDTAMKSQTIWIGNNCSLDSGMFVMPEDTAVEVCVLEYDGSGNVVGAADPDSVGRPRFVFDDDCRLVGVGHFDKVLSVLNDTTYCFKIIRTWCFADWCDTGKPAGDDWVFNPDPRATTFKYVQKILVECTCTCMIDCSDLRDTSIACEDVPNDLTTLYPLFNTPNIFHPIETEPCDDFSLDNAITTDTNRCGTGKLTNTWYLIDGFGMRVDSCKEVISLLSDSIVIDRQNKYQGDAEPQNCSDSLVLDPVELTGACPRLGPFTITNDSPFAENNGNDASGNYDVGVHLVNYTITDGCGETLVVTDTVTVIDDVNPLITGFSDSCVFFSEWQTDFDGDPNSPKVKDNLVIAATDNCPNPMVTMLGYTSDSLPSPVDPDTIFFYHRWQAVDMSGLTSGILETVIMVSDVCNVRARTNQISSNNEPSTHMADKAQMTGTQPNNGRLRLTGSPVNVQVASEVELYQNIPNPFSTETIISFVLPTGTEARMSIFDVTGKTLKVIEGYYEKGYHEVKLQKSDVGTRSIVYYRLDTQDFTATRKMVVID